VNAAELREIEQRNLQTPEMGWRTFRCTQQVSAVVWKPPFLVVKIKPVETTPVIAAAQPAPLPPGRAPAATSAMIAVRGLTKRIGRQEILRGIDLTVGKGETLVIIGRSGGGKSVLLKHLIGLMQPDAGEIWIDGQNIIGLSERKLAAIRRKVGILFQGGALFDSMTVEENIAFPLREAGERDSKVIREKVNEMLEVMEMEGQQRKMPVNLSGGMKKRVGLARSIIRRPSCILYDEPTSGLDPVVSDSINRLIRRLQERFHVTSIVVTHDMKSAFHLADHVAYLHEGRIYYYGTPPELQVSGDPLLQDFLLGRSEVSL
jgi:phospholipid/cholesterol/gamma-HCH transport system ATP-binding protein